MIAFTLSVLLIGQATANFNPNAPVGTLWYNTDEDIEPMLPPPPKQKAPMPQISYVQKMKIFQQHFDEVKTRAIIEPTIENLKAFQQMTNLASEMASNFTWQHGKMRLAHPEVDYAVSHPAQQIGANTYDAEMTKAQEKAVHQFSKNYGLMFFYKGHSMLDQQQSQILNNFASTYKISLMGISMDGAVLNSIKNSVVDQGQAERLGIRTFPAIVLFNNETKKIQPVKYGFATVDELLRAFYALSKNFKDLESI